MRLPLKFSSYTIPGFTAEQNSVYGRNLQELELPAPYARFITTAAQTVSTAAGVSTVAWQGFSTFFPPQGLMSQVSTGQRILIPFTGVWVVGVDIVWDTSTVGRRIGGITAIRGSAEQSIARFWGQAVDTMVMPMSKPVVLRAGDEIAVRVGQNSGTARTLGDGEEGCTLDLFGSGVAEVHG